MVVNSKTGEMHVGFASTTTISDSEFIDTYELQIMQMFSEAPYYLDFQDRSEWTEEQKRKYKQAKEQRHDSQTQG